MKRLCYRLSVKEEDNYLATYVYDMLRLKQANTKKEYFVKLCKIRSLQVKKSSLDFWACGFITT